MYEDGDLLEDNPDAKQNATKGERGDWRVIGLYNSIYKELKLRSGVAYTMEDVLPDPTKLHGHKKAQDAATRRLKENIISVVNMAAAFVKALDSSGLEAGDKRQLDILCPSKFPSKLKKRLALDTTPAWIDVSERCMYSEWILVLMISL